MTIKLINTENPDSSSIVNKIPIGIGIFMSDISSSMYSQSINVNYLQDELIVRLTDDTEEVPDSAIYYTPLYAEKLSYDEWKVVVNKTFRELN
jgi:hypothetical protein